MNSICCRVAPPEIRRRRFDCIPTRAAHILRRQSTRVFPSRYARIVVVGAAAGAVNRVEFVFRERVRHIAVVAEVKHMSRRF